MQKHPRYGFRPPLYTTRLLLHVSVLQKTCFFPPSHPCFATLWISSPSLLLGPFPSFPILSFSISVSIQEVSHSPTCLYLAGYEATSSTSQAMAHVNALSFPHQHCL